MVGFLGFGGRKEKGHWKKGRCEYYLNVVKDIMRFLYFQAMCVWTFDPSLGLTFFFNFSMLRLYLLVGENISFFLIFFLLFVK